MATEITNLRDRAAALNRYGYMFEGARRKANETMDRVFECVEIGRQMVVRTKAKFRNSDADPQKAMKSRL